MAYESKLKDQETDELFEAILTLESIDDCYKFFEDVCTINELKSIAQRLHVAKLLRQKKTYTYVEEVTGASTATISRVSRALNYGADGYNLILNRLGYERENEENQQHRGRSRKALE